jgi:hypothetical protein
MLPAVRELVTRKAGLTLDEGHRLGMEVVIAVAEARIDASRLSGSSEKVDDVASALSCALSAEGPSSADEGDVLKDPAEGTSGPFIQPSPSDEGSLQVVEDTVSEDDQHRLNAWAVNALEHMAAGQHHILTHLQEHPLHVTAAAIAVLKSVWHEHDQRWKMPIGPHGRLDSAPHHSSTPSTFALLRKCSPAMDIHMLIKEFCHERINGWETVGGLVTMPPGPFATALGRAWSYTSYSDAIIFHIPTEPLGLACDFVAMITTARAVRYLLDNALVKHSGISKLIFVNFWTKLLQLLQGMWDQQSLEVANKIRVTLILMGRCASTNHACKEIEYFFEEVEKRAQGNSPAVECLKVCHFVHPISPQFFRLISNDAVGHPKRTPMGGRLAF